MQYAMYYNISYRAYLYRVRKHGRLYEISHRMQVLYTLLRGIVMWTQCTIIILYTYMVSTFTLSVRITFLNIASVLVPVVCISNRAISHVEISVLL